MKRSVCNSIKAKTHTHTHTHTHTQKNCSEKSGTVDIFRLHQDSEMSSQELHTCWI